MVRQGTTISLYLDEEERYPYSSLCSAVSSQRENIEFLRGIRRVSVARYESNPWGRG